MDTLTKKTITTKRGFEYTYYVTPAAAGKPTLLLHHGFPDQAEEWEDLIVKHLKPAGYGVIAPDLLGYGGTSKPTDPAAYKFGGMTADVVEIVDAEKVDKVVSLGHDWGSRAAQMFFNLHPERVSGLVMVNVPWMGAAKGPFDLDAVLAQTEQVFGYGTFWYWKLFTADDVCLSKCPLCAGQTALKLYTNKRPKSILRLRQYSQHGVQDVPPLSTGHDEKSLYSQELPRLETPS